MKEGEKKENIKLSDKQFKLEKTLLNKVTKTQKDKCCLLFYWWLVTADLYISIPSLEQLQKPRNGYQEAKEKGYKLQVIYLIGEIEKRVRLYYKWGEENKYRRKRKEGIYNNNKDVWESLRYTINYLPKT